MIKQIPDIKTVAPSGIIKLGDRGPAVRLVQEWLTLRGHTTAIDSDFGPATAQAVKAYQRCHNQTMDSIVGTKTWASLWELMQEVFRTFDFLGKNHGYDEYDFCVSASAVAQMCKNVGVSELGQNQGPWVRLFFSQDPVNGLDGKEFSWCSAFVRFCIEQALGWLNLEPDKLWDYETGWSCDNVADAAQFHGVFYEEASPDTVKPGSIFLVRKSKADWVHTGFVESYDHENGVIVTIEGNSNAGNPCDYNGTHVVRRYRSVKNLDFITGYSGKAKDVSRTNRTRPTKKEIN